MPRRLLIAAMAAVVVLLAIVTFRGLDGPFGNGDEVFYAQAVREMKDEGAYGALRWQGQPVLDRPTLPFLPAAAISSFIDGELVLRLFAGICSLGILLVIYRTARELRLARDAAVVAVILVAGTPSFHLFSRALLSDPPFVFATTLLMWAVVRMQRRDGGGVVVAGAALGLALASKSLAVAVPALVLVPWMVRGARAGATARQLALAAAALVAVAAPYYLMSLAVYGGDFLSQHFGRALIARAQGDVGVGMPGGASAYAVYLWQAEGAALSALFPSACIAVAVLAWREKKAAIGVVAVTPLVGFLLYSLIATRLPHYLLPLYPACGLASAVLFDRMRSAVRTTGLTRAVPVAFALTMLGQGISETPDAHFMPSGESVRLGFAARHLQGSGFDTVYTLEWYAPAVAYYGERRWVMLTRSDRLFRQIDANDHIHAPRAVQKIPPWPEQELLVAGLRAVIATIPGSAVEVASSGDYVLARVVLHPGAQPRAGSADPR